MMFKGFPFPFSTLSDLSSEPIRQTVDAFKEFSSSFHLNPFKLITYRNSILVNRCRIAAFPDPVADDNCFLSILLVNKTIELEAVRRFAVDPSFSSKLPEGSREIYHQFVPSAFVRNYKSGEEWAFRQTLFALRVFITLAEDRDVDISTIADFDQDCVADTLGIDKNRWRLFSLMRLRPVIRITHKSLLESSFGVN